MATRQKTVEFWFDTDTTALASATRRDLAAITLYLPETTRTFRRVAIEVFLRDTVTTATVPTSLLLGIKLGAVAFDDLTQASNLPSGISEQASYLFARDVTSYFATNFGAGASQTCQVGVSITGPSTINISARVIITYDYDDAATTHVKTVRIPLESPIGNLTATLAELGTNQVPNLGTFCPEASKTFRQIVFVAEGMEGTSAVTDAQIGMSLDAGAEALDGLHENGLNSSCFYRRVWSQNAMTTSAVHAFKMRTTVTTMPCPCPQVVLYVTYEFDPSATTSVLNSLVLPIGQAAPSDMGRSATDVERLSVSLPIAEPTTIALVQSAVRILALGDAAVVHLIKVGAQAARTYSSGTSGAESAQHAFLHRIDSGGAQGAGATLARGDNTITIDTYTTGNIWPGIQGYVILNYTSGKAAGGVGAHNRSCVWFIGSAYNTTTVAALAPSIPETSYRVGQCGVETVADLCPGAAQTAYALTEAEVLSGEAWGGGYRTLASLVTRNDTSVNLLVRYFGDASRALTRWPGDPDTQRLVLTTARRWRITHRTTQTSDCHTYLWYTYHAITYAFAGTLSGFTGDGSGISVEVDADASGEKLGSVVTAVGGGYSFTWYDDVTSLFAHARQDATHLGRSEAGVAA